MTKKSLLNSRKLFQLSSTALELSVPFSTSPHTYFFLLQVSYINPTRLHFLKPPHHNKQLVSSPIHNKMAASIVLRRGPASPLLTKLTNPARYISAFRSFNTDSQSQVTTTEGNCPDYSSSVELRSSSGRSPARRRDVTPSFFSGINKH